MKQFPVCTAAGTEWLDSQRGGTGSVKMGKEQSCEYGFADAGISSGDKDNSRRLDKSHAKELTTDELG